MHALCAAVVIWTGVVSASVDHGAPRADQALAPPQNADVAEPHQRAAQERRAMLASAGAVLAGFGGSNSVAALGALVPAALVVAAWVVMASSGMTLDAGIFFGLSTVVGLALTALAFWVVGFVFLVPVVGVLVGLLAVFAPWLAAALLPALAW